MTSSCVPKFILKTVCLHGIVLSLCGNAFARDYKNVHHPQYKDTVDIQIDPKQEYQVMDNFGASDAWSGQYVGLWADSIKNKIADLLFSLKMDGQGSPMGVGLSAWRFNIGAGSADQGEGSGIKDPWRRAASFLLQDGQYDFSKAKGQMWFLKAATMRGVKDFIGFCNSAPYPVTINGLTYSNRGRTNLAPNNYGQFADYLVKIIKGVQQKTGILFNYISPVNEPQWDWSDGGQEGSPYRNKEIASIARVLNEQLIKNKLSTKISIAEAGEIDYLYEGANKPERGTQIQQFLMQDTDQSLLGLSNLSHKISAHSYFTTSPFTKAILMREKLSQMLDSARMRSGVADIGYWMSEYCILGDNAGEIDGNHRDLGMTSGLYLAKVIHMDLCYANASAWHWWLAISPYDYKDGLIYVDKSVSTGKFYDSKMLWAFGNYSRFIRPGYIRIKDSVLNNGSKDTGLLISSFKDAKKNKLVVVLVNPNQKEQVIRFGDSNMAYNIKDLYITSAKYNLHHISVDVHKKIYITLPAESVVTMTGRLN
ncbi:O-Glycosyl hydrolase [Arachidicoccus rhizosphaerae]|uniref:O-Glycosyl hydrolase n=2 Tax=Arachidicoccus rhizosphaerae TaxID=551991 RepID=A0A1H3Y7A2_9BACT|nr:O-Glycosyl hydrolase [Arachidicoccus rhizosphaerae]